MTKMRKINCWVHPQVLQEVEKQTPQQTFLEPAQLIHIPGNLIVPHQLPPVLPQEVVLPVHML